MTAGKIFNEDCLITLRQRIESESLNMVFTSPPYAMRRKDSYGGIPEEKYIEWFLPRAEEIKRSLTPDGSFFLNIKEHTNDGKGRSLYVKKLVIEICESLNMVLIDEYVWERGSFPGAIKNKFKNAWEPIFHFAKSTDIAIYPDTVAKRILKHSKERAFRKQSGMTKNGSGFQSTASKTMQSKEIAYPENVLHIPNSVNQYSENRWHSAVFAEDLVNFFILAFTKENDVVYDPFAGSGTLVKSCARLNRNFIASEILAGNFNKMMKDLAKHLIQPKIL